MSKLAIAVVGTFALCWTPFLLNATDAYHGTYKNNGLFSSFLF